jgi:hypothetical protein
VNYEKLGLILDSARKYAGLRPDELAAELDARGMAISTDMIYAWQSARTKPRLEHILAVLAICRPPGGFDFIREAVDEMTWKAVR